MENFTEEKRVQIGIVPKSHYFDSRKISIWKNIAVQINLLGLHYRTDKEVKTKWQNMQTSAKKQYADRIQELII